MANLHLVTGYAGREHVTAADQAVFHSYLLGEDQFVFDRGNKLAASIQSNNLIRIQDGDIYIHGRHVRLNEGSYVDLNIDNGTQGMKRNDMIVARYTKDASTSVEEVNLAVIKGTEAATDPADPAYTDGNILSGSILHEMPLYRVPLDGLNVGELVCLFSTYGKTIPELTSEKQEKTDSLTAEAALDDADAFPFFDASANAHRKTPWSVIKSFFAAATHKHAAGDITSGILAAARGGTGVSSISELANALGAASSVSGTYAGSGGSSKTFSFPFKAKILCIYTDGVDGHDYGNVYFCGLIAKLHYRESSGTVYDVCFTSYGSFDGYKVNDNIRYMNTSGLTYNYWAIG